VTFFLYEPLSDRRSGCKKEKPPGLVGGFSENFEFKAFNGLNINAGFSGFFGYWLYHWNWIGQN